MKKLTVKEAIKAMRKAKNIYAYVQLTVNDDGRYIKVFKSDAIAEMASESNSEVTTIRVDGDDIYIN